MKKQLTAVLLMFVMLLTMTGCTVANALTSIFANAVSILNKLYNRCVFIAINVGFRLARLAVLVEITHLKGAIISPMLKATK